MSGTDSDAGILNGLEQLLDRHTTINALDFLIECITSKQRVRPELGHIAIAFDSSAFLRLSSLKQREDVIDYLSSRHEAPIIFPGQVIQEFWNNHLNVVETHATSLKKKHEELRSVTKKIDSSFEEFHQQVGALIQEFEESHGYLYDENTRHTTLQALQTVKVRAKIPFAPRLRFTEIAKSRKRTKTPPGFKDEGDGDFFIWLDLLYGLMKAKAEGEEFSHVILVTNDTKVDWSRNNIPHPILIAEMESATGATFEVMKVDPFGAFISKELA